MRTDRSKIRGRQSFPENGTIKEIEVTLLTEIFRSSELANQEHRYWNNNIHFYLNSQRQTAIVAILSVLHHISILNYIGKRELHPTFD